MRKLLLALLLALTVAGVGGSTASAAPCVLAGAGYYHNGADGSTTCYHWADYSRPGTVDARMHGMDADWNTAYDNAASAFNSAIANVKMGSRIVNDSFGCDAGTGLTGIYAFNHNVCGGSAWGGMPCGTYANGQPYYYWLGCTYIWGSYNTLGQLTPHMAYAKEVIKTVNPTYGNGSPYTYTAYRRRMLLCHEISGHGYGYSHTLTGNDSYGDDSQAQANPGHESCLRAIMWDEGITVTAQTLGSTVAGQINGTYNHADQSYELAGIGGGAGGGATKLPPSVLKLRKAPGTLGDGKPVYVVPRGTDATKLPRTARYVALVRVQATSAEPPLLQSFRP